MPVRSITLGAFNDLCRIGHGSTNFESLEFGAGHFGTSLLLFKYARYSLLGDLPISASTLRSVIVSACLATCLYLWKKSFLARLPKYVSFCLRVKKTSCAWTVDMRWM